MSHPLRNRLRALALKRDRNGGIVPTDMARVKAVDLIALPTDIQGTNCSLCSFFRGVPENGRCINPAARMPVNKHQCCNLWAHPGTLRAWEHKG